MPPFPSLFPFKNQGNDLYQDQQGSSPYPPFYHPERYGRISRLCTAFGLPKGKFSSSAQAQDSSRIPIVTKAADYRKQIPKDQWKGFEKDLFCADLYESVKSRKITEGLCQRSAKVSCDPLVFLFYCRSYLRQAFSERIFLYRYTLKSSPSRT